MRFYSSRENQIEDERRRKMAGVVEDGESISFDILMRDGQSGSVFLTDSTKAVDKGSASIDQRLRAEIERSAKARGEKPSEYLAALKPADVQRLIESVASKYVSEAGATGIASAFSMDSRITAGSANHSSVCAVTGRQVTSPNPRYQAITDQLAAEAAVKRAMNDAAVTESVARLGRTLPTHRTAARVLIDAMRDARYR